MQSNAFELDVEADNEESFHRPSTAEVVERDEEDLIWEAIARLPSVKRGRFAILRRTPSEIEHSVGAGGVEGGGETGSTETIDVTRLDRARRELVVKKALASDDQDNYKLLSAIKDRLDRVGMEVPKVEVRFQNLNINANAEIGSRALPTLVNVARDFFEYVLMGLRILRPNKFRLHILKDISGVVKPGRMTLLLGPPGSGKSTLLLALAGKLDRKSLNVSGDITYNGTKLDEFYVRRTSAYISQTDDHLPELTVRETFDFAARCQGASEGMAVIRIQTATAKGGCRFSSRGIHFFTAAYVVRSSLGTYLTSCCCRRRRQVTSKKDQAQYWADPSKPYVFIPVSEMAIAFKNSRFGKSLESTLSAPYNKSQSHPSALSKTKYAASRWELLNSCFAREKLLMKGQSFLYIFRTFQVAFVAFFTSTIFLRTKLHPVDEINGNLYLSCLFFGMVHMMFSGFSELSLLIFRLPVFYKQRDNLFHPAWIWSVVSWIIRVPYSVIEAVVWSCVLYYTVGFAPSAGRFFRFILVQFVVHQMAIGLFRTIASLARDMVIANTFGSAALLLVFLLGGFVIPKDMHQISATGNNTVGYNVLHQHGLPSAKYWYWLGVGVLVGYAVIFNITVTLALAYLHPLSRGKAIVPEDTNENSVTKDVESKKLTSDSASAQGSSKKGMILPFEPLAMTFHNVNYFVDMPREMKAQGIPETRLQLLSNVSGVFTPGVLTALVGSSGAGKTALMDVLSGRKTGGYIEGDIKISGYPKVQETFARISGYVEQNDIHSPQVTVEESLWFSSSLCLPKEISKDQKIEFVEEVMRLVELDTLRNAIVGLPGSSGLSTEQRKRLTIAVELVANPSIIFMDEPTSGLDARAAAIVIRAVRNTVDTGRTVVCTIHQPSIDIFEAFDELLLLKRGGRVIYGGKLGVRSQILIDYFQVTYILTIAIIIFRIDGIPSIPDGYNPATWMLEITNPVVEQRIGRDFADIYTNSAEYREVEVPNLPQEAKSCVLEKPSLQLGETGFYDGVRSTIRLRLLGYWDTTKGLFMVMGALYSACLFLGINNASSVQPVVSIERTVFYREKAAGLYAPTSYAVAQGLVELPYIAAQAILFGIITYFMINFERTASKFFLYLVIMFLTFTYFTFYGMMAVGLTPSLHMAAVVSSAFYSFWNLLSGFLVPKPVSSTMLSAILLLISYF
ncbi:ABC transporter G family member 31-like [Gossypium australe]|uniref:ABC transporter G family member 31-like n=1 Tax=Gossypium australe TaxID=47621 RepID=A0A5B6UKN3_9ROSI|nr:ABC transporter G family member 31-like [Gossypium australe]